jgi:hypothetical protein
MAWTTPNSGRATGYVVTAANWNDAQANDQYLYDEINGTIRCKATANATQSVASGGVALLFPTEAWDDATPIHSTSSNTSRLTIAVAGKYEFAGFASLGVPTSGYQQIFITKNGGGPLVADVHSVTTIDSHLNLAGFQDQCIVGDYFELEIWHNNPTNLTCAASRWFSCERIGT